MRIAGDLIWARFLERTSRFTVTAEQDGRLLDCFLSNPGRLKELLVPGHSLLLRCVADTGRTRKTGFDVIGVCLKDKVITIDSRIPNALIEEALNAGSLREFKGYSVVKTEPAFGSGRFDFLLDSQCFVEVKSCTLVKNGVALFPDAPTARGRRHLLEMIEALKQVTGASSSSLFKETMLGCLCLIRTLIQSSARRSRMHAALESRPSPTQPSMKTD